MTRGQGTESESVTASVYDIAIIGGGINGCGIARDAAGRGLSVLLAEKGDLAEGTSSASTKLIHGGLRYLEHYQFRMVHDALREREVLWSMAPHIISPLRFVLPHDTAMRPAWLIRLGLFLYDHLGGGKALPASRFVDLADDEAGAPLRPRFTHGFEYSDCRVDDARLVVLNAVDAARLGAEVRVRTAAAAAVRDGAHWKVTLRNGQTGTAETVGARALVNAAGPWVSEVISGVISGVPAGGAGRRARLVKGSHIVVPRLFGHGRAYIFQNADKRIIFAIPFEEDFTLIGTTDVDFDGDPGAVEISDGEIGYLCAAASEYFAAPLAAAAVVWAYSGVRALYDNGRMAAQEATRDYVLELQGGPGLAPLLNIFGGKLTIYRRLAELALAKLRPHFPSAGAPWTNGAALPGGDFPVDGLADIAARLAADCPAIDAATARRLARAYGTRGHDILAGVHKPDDLGVHFGAGLYQCEVEYLIRHEWATRAEDILWRRTKLGLRLSAPEAARLGRWLAENQHSGPAP